MKALLLGMALLAGLAVPASAQQASASFVDAQGNEVGSAKLTQTPNGVLIELQMLASPWAYTVLGATVVIDACLLYVFFTTHRAAQTPDPLAPRASA